MARPRPEPSCPAFAARQNRSKACCSWSAAIPGPLSDTWIEAHPFADRRNDDLSARSAGVESVVDVVVDDLLERTRNGLRRETGDPPAVIVTSAIVGERRPDGRTPGDDVGDVDRLGCHRSLVGTGEHQQTFDQSLQSFRLRARGFDVVVAAAGSASRLIGGTFELQPQRGQRCAELCEASPANAR